MGKIQRLAVLLVLAAAPLFIGGPAKAVPAIQGKNFTFVSPLVGQADVSFQPFDPARGSLDDVAVEIRGALSFSVQLQPGEVLVPRIYLDVSRPFGAGFEFEQDGAMFILPGVGNNGPAAALFPFVTNYSLTFVFGPTADLIGGVVPTTSAAPGVLQPPLLATGQRSDFVQGTHPIDIVYEGLLFSPIGFTPAAGLNGSGAVLLTYDYTPATSTTAIPEPSSLLLVGIGLLGIAWSRRKAGA